KDMFVLIRISSYAKEQSFLSPQRFGKQSEESKEIICESGTSSTTPGPSLSKEGSFFAYPDASGKRKREGS
ncbi:MAG: hypothetical protein LPK19_07975, partial [Hymenobacteraceae bacterium]|nr:hypothetical protein [Hymenobacteraceae bacterium]MDX5396151.1 hypothetical protein [Hymenobacteraceae bacterium]MDX5512212.1 hypothetical protein [Hymenobacteraceae bacterium]